MQSSLSALWPLSSLKKKTNYFKVRILDELNTQIQMLIEMDFKNVLNLTILKCTGSQTS